MVFHGSWTVGLLFAVMPYVTSTSANLVESAKRMSVLSQPQVCPNGPPPTYHPALFANVRAAYKNLDTLGTSREDGLFLPAIVRQNPTHMLGHMLGQRM